jgi:hypothetical protein
MKDPLEAIALSNNATLVALVELVKCLTKNGALAPGQFSNALKTTFNHPEAVYERLDYELLRLLITQLDLEMGAPPSKP